MRSFGYTPQHLRMTVFCVQRIPRLHPKLARAASKGSTRRAQPCDFFPQWIGILNALFPPRKPYPPARGAAAAAGPTDCGEGRAGDALLKASRLPPPQPCSPSRWQPGNASLSADEQGSHRTLAVQPEDLSRLICPAWLRTTTNLRM